MKMGMDKLVVLFGRDTEALDTSLGNTVSIFISCLANVVGSLLVVLFVTPAVLFAVIPLGILYRQVQVSHLSVEAGFALGHNRALKFTLSSGILIMASFECRMWMRMRASCLSQPL